jgi:uncharacterized membrane protein YjjP (DUF1212 family)
MYKGYPQPFRTWLLILSAVIVALFIVQIVDGGGWVVFGIIVGLLAIQIGLARYARRQS